MNWTKPAYLLLSAAMIIVGVFSCYNNELTKAVTFVGIGIWVLLVALLVEEG